MKTRVLIVDDHVLISDGLKSLIESVGLYEVVALISDGLAVVDACRVYHPDLVIMDMHLPKMNGIEAIGVLKKRWPDVHILVLSAVSEEYKARQALDAGALGYVLKRSEQQVLLTGLSQVRKGKSFIDPSLDLQQINSAGEVSVATPIHLTPREKQVLQLIIEGFKNRDIAEDLHISLKTVETHRTNLMKKLDAHSFSELLQAARRQGLLLQEE